MSNRMRIEDKPNGPVAAVLLAGGIAAALLGILTTLSEASASFGAKLAWSAAVGPLTGKALIPTIVFFIAWAVLYFLWKDKEVNFNQIAMIALILLAIGLLGTFPPVFELFAAD